jgi:phospholipase C
MAYLTRQDIPFHYALADAFTVCDGYHCSLLGPLTRTVTTCGPEARAAQGGFDHYDASCQIRPTF